MANKKDKKINYSRFIETEPEKYMTVTDKNGNKIPWSKLIKRSEVKPVKKRVATSSSKLRKA